MSICKILHTLSLMMFVMSGVMAYAFVLDIEPLTADKYYAIERDVYNRSHDAGYADFPSFESWLAEQDRKEARFHDWVAAVGHELGVEAAYCFDPWYQGFQDTTQGHAGAAPDNWATGSP